MGLTLAGQLRRGADSWLVKLLRGLTLAGSAATWSDSGCQLPTWSDSGWSAATWSDLAGQLRRGLTLAVSLTWSDSGWSAATCLAVSFYVV